MRRLFLLVVAALAGCGGGEKSSVPSQFTYDDSKPLDPQIKPTSFSTDEVRVDDVSFTGPGDTPLNAYLLTPSGAEGRHPAVIYAHGAGGDRQELLGEALEMAGEGAVTLTLEMIYAPVRARPLPEGMEGVRANSKLEQEAVKEVRRAVDFLQSRGRCRRRRDRVRRLERGRADGRAHLGGRAPDQGVRPDRGRRGTGLRVRRISRAPADFQDELTTVLEKTDPLHFVALAEPSELLFQDGREDEVVPEAALKELAEAGSEPKEVRWYDAGHVPSEKMWADSRSWLSDHLGLTEASA